MSDLLKSVERVIGNSPRESVKLTEVRHLEDIHNEELRLVLQGMYKHQYLEYRLLATVINSIFTQDRAVFLFSRRILADLLKNDPNIVRNGLNSQEYLKFSASCIGSDKIIKTILASKKDDNKASVCELIHAEFLNLLKLQISEDIIAIQRNQTVGLYNSKESSKSKNTNTSQQTSQGTSHLTSQQTSHVHVNVHNRKVRTAPLESQILTNPYIQVPDREEIRKHMKQVNEEGKNWKQRENEKVKKFLGHIPSTLGEIKKS